MVVSWFHRVRLPRSCVRRYSADLREGTTWARTPHLEDGKQSRNFQRLRSPSREYEFRKQSGHPPSYAPVWIDAAPADRLVKAADWDLVIHRAEPASS
jgi:hypothetical protein